MNKRNCVYETVRLLSFLVWIYVLPSQINLLRPPFREGFSASFGSSQLRLRSQLITLSCVEPGEMHCRQHLFKTRLVLVQHLYSLFPSLSDIYLRTYTHIFGMLMECVCVGMLMVGMRWLIVAFVLLCLFLLVWLLFDHYYKWGIRADH